MVYFLFIIFREKICYAFTCIVHMSFDKISAMIFLVAIQYYSQEHFFCSTWQLMILFSFFNSYYWKIANSSRNLIAAALE